MLKALHAQESRDAADRKARAIVDGATSEDLRPNYSRAEVYRFLAPISTRWKRTFLRRHSAMSAAQSRA
jgi:hypothetical protein